jgi:hypothetical protein
LRLIGASDVEAGANGDDDSSLLADAHCVVASQGSLSTCAGTLLVPIAVSVNVDVFDPTRWPLAQHGGDVLLFFCNSASGCSQSKAKHVLNEAFGGRRRVVFAELDVQAETNTSVVLFEPMLRARAMAFASVVAVFQPRAQLLRTAAATQVLMEAKVSKVPAIAELESHHGHTGLALHTVAAGNIGVVTDVELARTVLEALFSNRREIFIAALRNAESIVEESRMDQLVNYLHVAFLACAGCTLPTAAELWPMAELHNLAHNGIVENLRMYQGLQDRSTLMQATERLVREKEAIRVLNIGVDLYTIQYEHLAEEWSPGSEWVTIELEPERAALYGSRSGGSYALNVMDLAQSPLIESNAFDLVICFGIIEPHAHKQITDVEHGALISGLIRGAQRVLRDGGKLLLHVSRKLRADELEESYASIFTSAGLAVAERPFDHLFVLRKK